MQVDCKTVDGLSDVDLSASSSNSSSGSTSAPPLTIAWAFGMDETVECVRPGTSVEFQWSGSSHNVNEVGSAEEFDNCNGFTDTAGAPGPYTWLAPSNEGIHYFVCGVSIHCAVGNIKATVEVSNNCGEL